MFDWGTFRERKEFYSGAFAGAYRFDHDHHHIEIRPRELARTMQILRHDMGFILLNDIVVTRTAGHQIYQQRYSEVQWDVTYHLFHLEAHQRFQVHLLLADGETLPEVGEWFPSATRSEFEARQALGLVSSETKPMEMPQIRTNPNLSEAPYPEELNQWYLFDLNHSLTRHQWALAVEAHEGKIQHSWLQGGYWKRDWESLASQHSVLSMQPLLDGLVASAAPLTNIAWVKTVEDYFQWRIPERAQAVRMIFMEMSRISHHLQVLGHVAETLAVDEAALITREAREHIRALFQFYCGSRVATRLGAFGGLSHDLPAGWVQEATQFMRSLDGALSLYRRMVAQHPLARRRLNQASITAQEALDAGITGPTLRAAGVNFDLRKSRPFYFYQDIDFDVPVGIKGDAFDRTLIFLEECRESLRILWQVIDNLPLGATMMEGQGLYELNTGTLSSEQWREWWQMADRAWSAQYTAVEGGNGELGFHLVMRPDSMKLWSMKIKTNAPLLAQALPTILQNCPVADLAPSLATLDIEASALDK